MAEMTTSEAIGNDDKLIEQYAINVKSAIAIEEKIKWRNHFTWALARHAISEELTMYPAIEKHMGQEGVELTNTDREQHQAVKEDLYRLQSLTSSPDFDPLIERLLSDLHNHIDHESNEDMPRVENLLTREESQALAKSFERTKMITPTRNHPSAPDRPYFENIVAMMTAPIDKVADLMRMFPRKSVL